MSRKATTAPAGDDDRRGNRRIWAAQIELLDAIRLSPEGKASLGDQSRRHDKAFADKGPWRGQAVNALSRDKLIEKAGAAKAKRPTRNSTAIWQWAFRDKEACLKRLRYLRDALNAKTKRGPDAPTSEPQSDQLNPHRRSKQRRLPWAD